MSHEIRTPLNAILDLAHLLRRPTRFSALHERIGKPVDPEALFSTLLKWLPDEDALLDAVSSPVAAAPAVIGWPSAQAVVVRLEALLAKGNIQTNEVFPWRPRRRCGPHRARWSGFWGGKSMGLPILRRSKPRAGWWRNIWSCAAIQQAESGESTRCPVPKRRQRSIPPSMSGLSIY